jgi:predicted AAA+ superfamily ATPase
MGMEFYRIMKLDKLKSSAFIFGPRMTGKTYLIRGLKSQLYVDLLDPQKELELKREPRHFWEEITALEKNSLVIVDEIQRVPSLLDYVQKGIEEKGLRFALSGSSARKLRRGGANLLGGRALDLKLHPLTAEEIGERFNIHLALQYGTLPKLTQILLGNQKNEAKELLRSYYTTYIKEEIQAEALTRNVGAFQRFLNVAAQGNGQVIEFQNISRECAVAASTVKEYYSILEDTLIGRFLWPWDRSERKKARPKFYFFDCGVVRALQNRLNDPPTALETGVLFENWMFNELIAHGDYMNKGHEIAFWREGPHEIDLLIMNGQKPLMAVECKTGQQHPSTACIDAFRKRFPKVPLIIASLSDKNKRKLESGVEILPWPDVIRRYTEL